MDEPICEYCGDPFDGPGKCVCGCMNCGDINCDGECSYGHFDRSA